MSEIEWIPIRVLLYIAKIDGEPIDNVIAEWTWFWNTFRRRGMTPRMRAMLREVLFIIELDKIRNEE